MERAFHCKGDGGCHGGAVLLLVVELVTMTLLLMDGYDGSSVDVVMISSDGDIGFGNSDGSGVGGNVVEIVDVGSDGGNISVGGDVGVACGIGGAGVGMMVVVVGDRSDDDDGNIGGVSMVTMIVVLLMDNGIVTGSGRIGNGCGGEGDLTAYESVLLDFDPPVWVSIFANLLDILTL